VKLFTSTLSQKFLTIEY